MTINEENQFNPEIHQNAKVSPRPKENIDLSKNVPKTNKNFNYNPNNQINQRNETYNIPNIPETKTINTNHQENDSNIDINRYSGYIKPADNSNKTNENKQQSNLKSSMLGSDFKIDHKLAKKEFTLPVKSKGLDYFKLIDTVKKLLDNGQKDVAINKVDLALPHLELALYYLQNIEK